MNTHPDLAVFGDWHGDAGWALTSLRSAARGGVRTAIHVGDFGLDWPGANRGRYEDKLNKHLIGLGMTLVVSGGNHDNWATIEKLDVGSDGLASIRSNIKVLPRGGRTVLEAIVIGGLGGAFSVDFHQRTEGKDWWSNEEPTQEEAGKLIAGGPVDILITHDAPIGVPLEGIFELCPETATKAERTRVLLRQVVDSLAVPNVFCGHWHQRRTHLLTHPDGRSTRVDVLDMQNSRLGNGVLIWREETSIRIEPLQIRGVPA